MMKEKEIIDKFFVSFHDSKLPSDIKKGVGDDAAILSVGNEMLAVSVDTVIEGVHFYPGITAENLGFRSVAVALSDMAAMCAVPKYITLSLSLEKAEFFWMDGFLSGVKSCLNQFDCYLVGGDTVKGPLSVSVQVIGVCELEPIYRSGAKEGELVAVTGFFGCAKTALSFLNKEKQKTSNIEYVLDKYHKPSPRINVASRLGGYISSAIDISDGLISDIGHIAQQSNKKINIFLEKIPIDPIILRLLSKEEAVRNALTGGDDYELAFTFNRKNLEDIEKIGKKFGIPITVIGAVESGQGVNVLDQNGNALNHSFKEGFAHF